MCYFEPMGIYAESEEMVANRGFYGRQESMGDTYLDNVGPESNLYSLANFWVRNSMQYQCFLA